MADLPIVHIEQLCEELGVSRGWINRNWLSSTDPPPHWRSGDSVFFSVAKLDEWAQERCSASG